MVSPSSEELALCCLSQQQKWPKQPFDRFCDLAWLLRESCCVKLLDFVVVVAVVVLDGVDVGLFSFPVGGGAFQKEEAWRKADHRASVHPLPHPRHSIRSNTCSTTL